MADNTEKRTQNINSSVVSTHQRSTIFVKRSQCADLYEKVLKRVQKAQVILCKGEPAPARPEKYNSKCNKNKITRMARISGLYAASFNKLEQQGVYIPFVGTAAYASNVVRWNVTEVISILDIITNQTRGTSWPERPISFPSPYFIIFNELKKLIPHFNDLVNLVFAGNYLVFMEIFPIVDFTIRYIDRHGNPKTPSEIKKLKTCLDDFVDWWREQVQSFSEVAEFMKSYKEGAFLVDRRGYIREGIALCLVGDSLIGSRDKILRNEQLFTLEEYMWKKIVEGEKLKGVFDNAFIKELIPNASLIIHPTDMQFSYELNDDVDDDFILNFPVITFGDLRSIADKETRFPYTQKVVEKFHQLYTSSETKPKIQAPLNRMIQDAGSF